MRQPTLALLAAALACGANGHSTGRLTLHAPAALAGDYWTRASLLSRKTFDLTADISIAATCPCNWTAASIQQLNDELGTHALLLPDQVCESDCSLAAATCTAASANISALLVSCGAFLSQPAEPTDDQAICSAVLASEALTWAADGSVLDGCLGGAQRKPTLYVEGNFTRTLERAVTVAPDPSATPLPSTAASENLVLPMYAPANATLHHAVGDDDDDGIDCSIFRNVPFIYAGTSPIWLLITLLWFYNTGWLNEASARDIHRLLGWVPAVQFVHALLSLFNYSACPWKSPLALVAATFWAVLAILKEPLLLLCLLLLAKGWCITRNALTRREVGIAACTVALLYAAVSIQLSVASVVALVPMVIMYLVMLVNIWLSINDNLRILKAQMFAIQSFGIDPRTTPVYTKYWMFRRLKVFTAMYVVFETAVHSIFSATGVFWVFVLLHQLFELFIALSIGYTFRAQPFNVMFQQVQQVATELAEQMLPSITTVEVKPEMFNDVNLIAWQPNMNLQQPGSGPPPPMSLVVLNPGDEDVPGAEPATEEVLRRQHRPPPLSPHQSPRASPDPTRAPPPPPPPPGSRLYSGTLGRAAPQAEAPTSSTFDSGGAHNGEAGVELAEVQPRGLARGSPRGARAAVAPTMEA